ncbi:MAG: DUF3857 domain-containing protein, partial [Chlorobi bacterium]|nr:DUF3857 domain-containing protein [Chlorobiota bacterium]
YTNLFSQKAPIKYGKISIDDLKMEYYDKDSSAPAVVLCDYGETHFSYNQDNGFQLVFNRTVRIKILKKEGYDYANFEIPVYKRNNQTEKVSSVKGITYNLVNGKIKKDKLNFRNIYQEETDANWTTYKFSMPNIEVGSVVDVHYSIISDFFFNLKNWYFQNYIPVKWSEYRVKIPEFFHYKLLHKGYESLAIFEKDKQMEKFTYNYSSKISNVNQYGGGGRASGGTASFDSNSKLYRFAAKNVVAFKKEPYITSVENFITKVEFELATIEIPGRPVKSYTTTWETINKKLIQNEYFGRRLLHTNFLSEIVDTIISSSETNFDKINAIRSYIIHNFKWNGKETIYVYDNLKTTLSRKAGSVADINMLLIAMIRKAGITADPVLLSTRDHGIIFPGRPMISAFNYLIAKTEIDGNSYLIDATDPNCPINVLPKRCLNSQGRSINIVNSGWVNLKTTYGFKQTTMLALNLTDNFVLKGNLKNLRKGYAALSFRDNINNSKNEESYIKKMMDNNPGLSVIEYHFDNLDSINLPIEDMYNITLDNKIENAGNLLYFNPILFERLDKNPFKLENRKYPVDYAYPINKTYILNFTIPEGYQIEELPQNITVLLPENAGSFNYKIIQYNNMLQVSYSFNINKTLFVQDEYHNLKDFYDKVISKESEQIILKQL